MAPVVLLLLVVGHASGKDFLSSKVEIDSAYINLVIQSALDDVFGHGHGVKENRLDLINATLAPLFNALPRNQYGRLSTPSMRYAVQRYFSQRHGWVVKGFEPHAANTSDNEAHAAHIVQGKIPGYIEGVLTKTLSKGGFALEDIAIVVATIETLIFDENLKAVDTAYHLNSMSTTSPLGSRSALVNILVSYFILEYLKGDSSNAEQHLYDAAHIGEYYPHWQDTLEFMEDIVGEDAFLREPSMNPFASHMAFAFEDVARITRTISERFGPFSNHECQDMKSNILEMDSHGTGRVKLSDFYATGQFLESPEYLESLGALDTSSVWHGPQVIIPNFLMGINNCISTGVYYDVCCLNECDGIFQHLEARIMGPTASAAQISQAIEEGITVSLHLSASAPTEPRNLSVPLRERLAQIAAHHDGLIPLHGRLFAQWLHYAFPRECPFPHLSGSVARVYDSSSMSSMKVTDEDMVRHIESEVGRRAPSPEAGLDMWTLQEELLDPEQIPGVKWGSAFRSAVHMIMLVSFSALVLKELSRRLHLRTKHSEHATTDLSYYI